MHPLWEGSIRCHHCRWQTYEVMTRLVSIHDSHMCQEWNDRITRLPENQGPGFYSLLFLVRNQNRHWRPIIDRSKLNKQEDLGTFKIDAPDTIQGNSAVSIHLQDAYFHVPIRERSMKLLRFTQRCNLGINMVPLILTHVMREVNIMPLKRNVKTYKYLTEWLIRFESPEKVAAKVRAMLI